MSYIEILLRNFMVYKDEVYSIVIECLSDFHARDESGFRVQQICEEF